MNSNPIDTVLESVLGSYQLRVEITANVRYCGSWFEQEPATRYGQFHLLTEGECWVQGDADGLPQRLQSGDLIVFPAGMRHSLVAVAESGAAQPQAECETAMLCGELEFIMGSRHPIFNALPAYFVVRSQDSSDGFRALASMLAQTSTDRRWGRQMVQNKLADSLFTMAVCEYVRAAPDPRGLLAALADPRLCRALSAVHARPGDDWTIQSMAQQAGMSRTAYAELFSEVLGVPPIQYLANWRAIEAKRLLRNRRLSVASIAELLGYKSEAAFRRFFKRLEGVGPGKVRSEGADD
ncbi:AraC family transcriptional regulator [Hydrocarboniphaga effusa]|jgi:AraC family transcriptional activator of mtrCDE|uniref:HTH araC/xylS-type domain-containing protein n=1 Tax=Hydrocarboniphaga effusa AP103 TaxID=1172194 RepID=I8I211_9GAMM|nr:AraC family transcriptional regulator [Hydrocarboniphaga effusa]EIT69851.1 hypothetical protein WQQ_34330 [Hydrocarboniphaga effusa AP103]